MELYLIYSFVIATGACIGSFLNVVALRALTNESIILPSSKCPICSNPIKWYDNIPIISYFFTFKGRCRNCNEKVSKLYPIVESITAVIFLLTYLAFGCSIKTLLLLALFCISIVIIITDIKKEYVFDRHAWILIIISFLTSFYINKDYVTPIIGLIVGFIAMEVIAKISYYLIKKTKNNLETTENLETKNKEDFDINEYINTQKRGFGEGDSYLAAAMGALLGWKYLFLSIFLSIIIQALCILPKFMKNLYIERHFKLVVSLTAFCILAALYWIISNITELNFYVMFIFIVLLTFFAVNAIRELKQINNNRFTAIPFGPALLVSSYIILFYGEYIVKFLFNHIFI